jgi:ATP-dependent Clp protease adaptor protein ClpS
MSTKTKTNSKTEEILSKPYVLVLHNDDKNNIDWIISCLMNICKHEYEQAVQCANITHFNGKCDIKYGELETISEMNKKLLNSGVISTVESN